MEPDGTFSSDPPGGADGQESPSLPAAIDNDLYCPHCGYNLRGLTSGRCPECGNAFDLAAMSRSQIPWLHRAEVGRMRAWWRTCWMALRRPNQFAASINAPCPYADARRFWLVNVAIVCVPVAVLCFVFRLMFTADALPFPFGSMVAFSPGGGGSRLWWAANAVFPWMSSVVYWPVATLASVLSVLFITGSVSYLFQIMTIPRRQQDRAAAMGLYSSGAIIAAEVVLLGLALTVGILCTVAGVAAGFMLSDPLLPFIWGSVVGAASALTPVVWAVMVWTLYRRLCHAGVARSAGAGVLLCLTSLVSLVIAWGILPWCMGLLWIIWISLQA